VSNDWVADIERRLVDGSNIKPIEIRALIDAVRASWIARGTVLSQIEAVKGSMDMTQEIGGKPAHSVYVPLCMIEDWISWMSRGKGIPMQEYDRLYAMLPQGGGA
jgi:hypothetical protein